MRPTHYQRLSKVSLQAYRCIDEDNKAIKKAILTCVGIAFVVLLKFRYDLSGGN
ncbi:hypothetical protein predicted by Glimmer/Critica [Lactiplantibacillus plantarum]|nr:hypothetical protein predicted by Glimmer/Critica [Lactiplantibacillus plantarum]